MSQNKVYCDNCKHFYQGYDMECHHPSNKYHYNTYSGRYYNWKDSPSDINGSNNCKQYSPTIVKQVIDTVSELLGL